MTPEQLQAAYDDGSDAWFNELHPADTEYAANHQAHLAGLAEVARQQAERDAQIADELASLMNNWGHEPKDIAAVIREQFGAVHE